MPARRIAIEIHGAVQGVGFRPFVYRLANEVELTGWVINDSRGVFIEVEGDASTVDHFLRRLSSDLPAIAHIDSITVDEQDPIGSESFEIRHSDDHGAKTAVILPDLATCGDCLAEILDPDDRRFGYPFTNCTNCGPRFTIIRDLPYDRPNTSMASFTMCQACQAEYEDPSDRRFHAQPNACQDCGPQLTHVAADGVRRKRDEALKQVASALRDGQIVAVKALGGFQLMVDATNDAAIAELRIRKRRPTKPLAVMVEDLSAARSIVVIDEAAASVLSSPQAPIVLLERVDTDQIAPSVAPGNPDLGVMLPTTPLHHLLAQSLDFPLVATSGNLSDEPICIDNDEALERLGGIADTFLLHDRPIVRHVDDSVAWLIEDEPRLLRRARGYAPLPTAVPDGDESVLATGAHLKNTISITVGNRGFTSQHIGDLSTVEAHGAFRRVIDDLTRMYDVELGVVAHDLHPDYLSTAHAEELARGRDIPTVAIQHHHAHFASCLLDNGFEGEALGVSWDGTGFGSDGTIWGGEFLAGTTATFERVGHLRTFLLPGGDAAVREPRRSAAGLLHELGMEIEGHLPANAFEPSESAVIAAMLDRGLNSPTTTSAGRLFDGISALLGLATVSSFEGEGAMALEHAATDRLADPYDVAIEQGVVDWEPIVRGILDDRSQPGLAASRFHASLSEAIVTMAESSGLEHVALTGGCFQNRALTERTASLLRQRGFIPLLHRQIPPNDGGISIGQIAVARSRTTS